MAEGSAPLGYSSGDGLLRAMKIAGDYPSARIAAEICEADPSIECYLKEVALPALEHDPLLAWSEMDRAGCLRLARRLIEDPDAAKPIIDENIAAYEERPKDPLVYMQRLRHPNQTEAPVSNVTVKTWPDVLNEAFESMTFRLRLDEARKTA